MFGIDVMAGSRQIFQMSPINADKMNRPIHAHGDGVLKTRPQKMPILGWSHLARRHHKLAVTCFSEVSGMSVDCDVVGRIHEGGASRTLDNRGQYVWSTSVTAGELVIAELPHVPDTRNSLLCHGRNQVCRVDGAWHRPIE